MSSNTSPLAPPLAVVVLAAGQGTRMNSPLAKVLQPLAGHPLLHYVLETSRVLDPDRLVVVVGFQSEKVKAVFRKEPIEFVEQTRQLGTGHAVLQAEGILKDFSGDTLVLCGDMPLIHSSTLQNLVDRHRSSKAQCTLLTLKKNDISDFGRILRDGQRGVLKIVEMKDATEEEKRVDELNSGVYCFDNKLIFKALKALSNNNAQKEYYLTDTVEYMVRSGFRVESVDTREAGEIFGINSQEDLRQAERLWQERNQAC